MIYFIEGPDGTGKTTLARNIAINSINNRKTCLFFHCTNRSSRKTADEDYSEFLEDLKTYKAKQYDVVIDRGWISNVVYTTVFEPEKAHISDEVANKLFEIVDKTIVCLPKDKSRYLNHFLELAQARREDYIQDMDKVYDMFNTYANRFCRYDMFEHITDHPELINVEEIND